MVKEHLLSLFTQFSRIGADPQDSDELRLQKAVLVSGSFLFELAGLLWGIIYILLGQVLSGLIPLSYTVVSLVGLVVFARNRRFGFLRFTQLLAILMLPFLVQASLGGFVSSSAVILWSLFAPLMALLLSDPKDTVGWFLLYAAMVILSALVQPWLDVSNPLPPAVILTFFVMNVTGVSAIAFVLLYYFVGQKNEALTLLRLEQDKSENLLLNVLPRKIAKMLKASNGNHGALAEHFEAVSILFADMVGFTPLSTRLAPAEMVDLLNEIFSQFDALVDKYGLEKIRTIGDNYMVASGVPQPRPDHAQALALMALDMCECLRNYPFPEDKRLNFRMGMSCGPVVAGIIGRQKFHYDIWGDAVNIASRMESQGVPGKIQITRQAYELLKVEFICNPRGTMEVKGKGLMETWFLEGVKAFEAMPGSLEAAILDFSPSTGG
ncbi:MAG TPA: adenylate/guanylate cyclase domain-containing protein [Anaerolineales bacterium]|nr:adenylate/guanylate cyclase domain-containing protein [Anaerolineales bacterium]